MLRLGWVTGGVVVLGAVSALALADRPQPTPPHWISDYARAKSLARQAGKPIFLTFH
jgi:hypothetical protein